MHIVLLMAYIAFIVWVVWLCRRFRVHILGIVGIVLLLVLAPGWDAILAKVIMLNFERSHSPLQQINRKVDRPQSVLWIDEVWPGFDDYGRHWMVKNYLDGVHLQMLALNDGKGKIHVYQANPEDYAERDRLRPEIEATRKAIKALHEELHRNRGEQRDGGELGRTYREQEAAFRPRLKTYEEAWERDLARIIARAKVYPSAEGQLPADLPPFAYQVRLHRLHLPEWQEEFAWCDQIDIVDNSKQETIAFSKRCLGYRTRLPLFKEMGGSGPFSRGRLLGDERAYSLDDKVLFEYATDRSGYDGERTRKFSPKNNK